MIHPYCKERRLKIPMISRKDIEDKLNDNIIV